MCARARARGRVQEQRAAAIEKNPSGNTEPIDSEGISASQKNCSLSINRSSIDKIKQLSINELLDNLHP